MDTRLFENDPGNGQPLFFSAELIAPFTHKGVIAIRRAMIRHGCRPDGRLPDLFVGSIGIGKAGFHARMCGTGKFLCDHAIMSQ